MQVKVQLKGNKSTAYPTCKIIINEVAYYDDFIEDIQILTFDIEPYEKNILKIEHYGKQNSDTIVNENNTIVADKSLELLGIKLNDVDVFKVNLYNCPFYVQWPPNKIREFLRNNKPIPNFIKQQLYFGFNGVYEFTFDGDIQKEYFNQFWLDECQSNENQTLQDNRFNRFGELVDINAPINMTIYELEKLIKK
jgi:hypothetical protein